jgi:hypothetical protein
MGIGANPARPQGGGRRLTEGANRGIAVLAGLALGVVLARILDSGDVHVGLLDVAAVAGSAAAVVLAVTDATLPLLWRTMRPEALRTE